MINLIPPEGQKVVKREYIFRVGGTIGLLIGGVFVILTVATIPMYVLIGAQMKASLLEAQKEEEDTEAFARADVEVRMTKDVLRQLTEVEERVPMSGAIEEVERLASEEITFRTFLMEEGEGAPTMRVQGTASTREELARFKTALESSTLFATADVPIADLARDVDLPFTVSLTFESKTP